VLFDAALFLAPVVGLAPAENLFVVNGLRFAPEFATVGFSARFARPKSHAETWRNLNDQSTEVYTQDTRLEVTNPHQMPDLP